MHSQHSLSLSLSVLQSSLPAQCVCLPLQPASLSQWEVAMGALSVGEDLSLALPLSVTFSQSRTLLPSLPLSPNLSPSAFVVYPSFQFFSAFLCFWNKGGVISSSFNLSLRRRVTEGRTCSFREKKAKIRKRASLILESVW